MIKDSSINVPLSRCISQMIWKIKLSSQPRSVLFARIKWLLNEGGFAELHRERMQPELTGGDEPGAKAFTAPLGSAGSGKCSFWLCSYRFWSPVATQGPVHITDRTLPPVFAQLDEQDHRGSSS